MTDVVREDLLGGELHGILHRILDRPRVEEIADQIEDLRQIVDVSAECRGDFSRCAAKLNADHCDVVGLRRAAGEFVDALGDLGNDVGRIGGAAAIDDFAQPMNRKQLLITIRGFGHAVGEQ